MQPDTEKLSSDLVEFVNDMTAALDQCEDMNQAENLALFLLGCVDSMRDALVQRIMGIHTARRMMYGCTMMEGSATLN